MRYGGEHQALRRAALPYAAGSACARCGRPILPGQPVDLDHTDDRAGYLGWSHRRCNRSAGARKGNAARRAQLSQRRERVRVMLLECALGVEVSEDRRHVSVAAAGWPPSSEGFAVIELAAYLDYPADVVATVTGVRDTRTVLTVAIDPHSNAANLIRPLSDAGIPVTELSTADVVVAHGDLLDELNGGRLRHVPHPQLDAAVRHGMQRRLGGASTWERRGAPVDVGPLTAATWALWALRNTPVLQVFTFGTDDNSA
ncbi:MAG: hypothetical protein ACRDWG_12120 [Actinomycetes bacterium]